MPDVLEQIRVLDFSTGPVGGIATMVLADFGADVVKIERPGGDRFRTLAAAPMWLRGKRSVVADLASAEGAEAIRALVEGADVVVASGNPARFDQLGVDADAVLANNPTAVHCAITPFGARGPYAEYPGYEALVAAKAGRMAVFARQLRREGPGFAAVPIASHAAAQGAVQGIAAALFARERTGRGQRVETSLLQALMPYDLAGLLLFQLAERAGTPPVDPLSVGGDMPTLNYHPILASDGRWIQCGNLLEHLFTSFLDAIDLLGELLAETRFQDSPALWDPETIEAARDRILLRVRERTADEWMERFHQNGNVAAEPYLTTGEALDHPDLTDNGSVLTIRDPDLGPVRQLGPIARLVATPARPCRPAPRVGEHTAEVLAEARVPRTFERTREPARGRPLDGITILEFATIIAAPLGTTMLADLGARVIKVETLTGDPYRELVPGGLLAVKTNAGKESICLDLKCADGRAIARDLVRGADVLVHNFRPGVPEKLGIDYAAAREIRPDLVWVSANGYGPDGPGARRPMTHPVAGAAMGGAGHQAGPALRRRYKTLREIREGARQLMRANEANPDPNTSVIIASATLLGLLARERFGLGQAIYVDMLCANAYANADDFLHYEKKPDRPAVDDDLLGLGPTYRLYPARSGWIFFALTTDGEWQRFCGVAERPKWRTEAHTATAEARAANAEPLVAELAALFATRDADDWEKAAVAVRVGVVRADATTPGRFLARDPHNTANDFVPTTRHARFGEMKRWGPLVTVGGAAHAYGPGALAGDATDRLLAELGRDAAEIARLRAEGVVACEATEPLT